MGLLINILHSFYPYYFFSSLLLLFSCGTKQSYFTRLVSVHLFFQSSIWLFVLCMCVCVYWMCCWWWFFSFGCISDIPKQISSRKQNQAALTKLPLLSHPNVCMNYAHIGITYLIGSKKWNLPIESHECVGLLLRIVSTACVFFFWFYGLLYLL